MSFPLRRGSSVWDTSSTRTGKSYASLEERVQKAHRAMVLRRPTLLNRGRTVKKNMSTHGEPKWCIWKDRQLLKTLRASSSLPGAWRRTRYGSNWRQTHSVGRGKGWKEKLMGIHLDESRGNNHHICSIPSADNYWVMSHSKKKTSAADENTLIEEAQRWSLEPKLASL